jgi:hypothetical protein
MHKAKPVIGKRVHHTCKLHLPVGKKQLWWLAVGHLVSLVAIIDLKNQANLVFIGSLLS